LLDLYTNEEWDGWAKTLARGATATWESWNALDGTESLSHSWGAVGLVGYVRYILGFAPLEPQHSRVPVRPLLFADALTQASGRLFTDRGEVKLAWARNENGSYAMDVRIPDTMTAELWIPSPGGTGDSL